MNNLLTQKPVAISVIAAAILIVAAATTQSIPNPSFAQQNNATTTQPTGQNTSSTAIPPRNNASTVIDQGNVTRLTLNRTIIPLQTTTIEVRTITKSIDNKLISELQNTTLSAGAIQSPSIDLSKMTNQTVTNAIGKATSTIITRTDIPYNVTTFQLTTSGQAGNVTQNIAPSEGLLSLFAISPTQQQQSGATPAQGTNSSVIGNITMSNNQTTTSR